MGDEICLDFDHSPCPRTNPKFGRQSGKVDGAKALWRMHITDAEIMLLCPAARREGRRNPSAVREMDMSDPRRKRDAGVDHVKAPKPRALLGMADIKTGHHGGVVQPRKLRRKGGWI